MSRALWTGEEFETHVKEALQIAVTGMTIDGAHHKQWHLQQVCIALGMDPTECLKELEEVNNVTYQRPIAP